MTKLFTRIKKQSHDGSTVLSAGRAVRMIMVQTCNVCPYFVANDDVLDCDFCTHPDKAGDIGEIESNGFPEDCPI